MTRVVPEPVCEFCGSRVCLKWSDVKCRHTGQTRTAAAKANLAAVTQPASEAEAGEPTEEASNGLADMTIADLRAYADDHGIDLGDARLKADIIHAIEESEGEAEGDD